MLDLVLQGKSALAGLQMLGTFVLFGIVLLLVSAAFFVIPTPLRDRRIFRTFFLLTTFAGVVLLALPPAVFLYANYNHSAELSEKFDMTLELPSSPAFSQFDRKNCRELSVGASVVTNCVLEGDIHLRIVLPATELAFEHARMLWGSGDAARVSSVKFISAPYSTNDIATKVNAFASPWNGDVTKLTAWKAQAGAGGDDELTFSSWPHPTDTTMPHLQLGIRRIQNSIYQATPWYLTAELHWGS